MAVTKQLLDSEETISLSDTITVTANGTGYSTIDYGAVPSIGIGTGTTPAFNFSAMPNVTIGGAVGSGTSANAIWTTTGTGTSTNWNYSAIGAVQVTPQATIALKGEDADIDLNGKSLKTWMEKVEERLNILTPNPELEKEWDELRKLGEKYRKLEKKCKEKAEVWKKLKSMPPPTQD